ncbi:unnamed protein product [Angiostrongylus costaricensis]|uniref:NDK domain-containing protein n=1 Tax=Angiostrongylus costaricensis TaxID=334426 RepID=A0A158PG82_ANGCS|nr:unnamed protein product [Angiostrongylus costaricensis]
MVAVVVSPAIMAVLRVRLIKMWSLMIIKPDIVAHPPLLQVVLRELLSAGVVIGGARKLQMTTDIASQLYAAHKGKYFFKRLVCHVTSGPVIAMCVDGDVRRILGGSRLYPIPKESEFSTLRQRYSLSTVRNVAHASDPEATVRELALFEPFESPDSVLNDIFS